MKIYKGLEEFSNIDKPVVTTGTFDGVHQGHQKILNRLKEVAEKEGGETVLLTLFPHPRMVLYPDNNDLKLLNTLDEKITLLRKAGIDHLIIHPFSDAFSRLSSVEFVREILVNSIGVKTLVIGYDHHFGRNREGTLKQLKEYGSVYGFEIEEIPAQDIDNVNISSTKIRDALINGDIKTANTYLGYDYFLSGNVIMGSNVGRSLGFPTANIKVEEKHKLVPANGVYVVKIKLNGEIYQGMLNIGVRPTLSTGSGGKPTGEIIQGTQGQEVSKRSIETHIFNFDKNIYDQRITLYFIARIRDEKRFDDLEALKRQLVIDKEKSINLLS
ncbi:MAG: riboflavin biosynthesis protein RibF [Bacteroidota bacterium]